MPKAKILKVRKSYFTNQGEEIKIIKQDKEDNTFLGETFDGFVFWYSADGRLLGHNKDYKLSINMSK